jgi:ABC-type multidrug transport system fused ATPase/permease subunit
MAVGGTVLSTTEMRRWWMRRVGYVAQTPYLLDATLAENVAFGVECQRIDRDRVVECCRQAAMGDFLDSLPQGLDTELGERGVLLSGGQRQRVAIARALYLRPEVLIFDEATSALDTRNEELILRTARELRSSLTQIVVAHRLSTVEDCDTVVWLDQGRIRMQGPAPEVVSAYRAYLDEGGLKESARKVLE